MVLRSVTPRVLACLAFAAAGGCIHLRIDKRRPTNEVITATTEDGSRYVSVQGGRRTTPTAMVERWKAAAHKSCDGEYIPLSDAGFAQRRLGVVIRRTHEGYVRCVNAEPDEGPPDKKSAAAASRART